MSCISWLVSLLLTVIIPLKLTYSTLKANQKSEETKMWAIYWSIYCLFSGFFWLCPCLAEAPFKVIFVVILVWLYHDSFKGALVINQLIQSQVRKIPVVADTINMIAEKGQFLKVFESEKPIEKAKDN